MAPIVPYQIDFSVKNIGKAVANTKKKIRFRFGFANADALASGAKGIDCRGMEHDVTFTWSITSGKTIVECDRKEIHFSMGGSSKFQFSWPMKKDVFCELVAHAAPYSSKSDASADWRQYDLTINGLSYFDIPKIYELGVVPFRALEARPVSYGRNAARNAYGGNFGRSNYHRAPPPPPSNWAAPPPVREQAPPSPPKEANLLDFGSEPAPLPQQAPIQQAQLQQQNQYQQPQPQQYVAPPPPEFAVAPPTPAAPPAPPVPAVAPTIQQQQPANEQQQQFPAYAVAPPAPPAAGTQFHAPAPAFAAAPATQFDAAPVVEEAPVATAAPQAEVLALPPSQPEPQHHDEKRNPGTMLGVERALGDLVNLNDITSSPDLQVGKLTMMSPEDKKKAAKPAFNNERPLSELQSTTTAELKKSVMNTFNPSPSMQQQQPGMYGAQPGYQHQMPMPQQQQQQQHQQQQQAQGMYGQGPPPINSSYGGMGMGGFQQQSMQQQQTSYSNYQY